MAMVSDYRKDANNDYKSMIKDQMMNDLSMRDRKRSYERMADHAEVGRKIADNASFEQQQRAD